MAAMAGRRLARQIRRAKQTDGRTDGRTTEDPKCGGSRNTHSARRRSRHLMTSKVCAMPVHAANIGGDEGRGRAGMAIMVLSCQG